MHIPRRYSCNQSVQVSGSVAVNGHCKKLLLAALFSFPLLGVPLCSLADSLVIPDISRPPSQAPNDIPRPSRSMTMEQVREQFGEPLSVEGPVGDPPITRWIYDNYVVHFEHEYVIHTVIKRN